jgi:hypothetical protein
VTYFSGSLSNSFLQDSEQPIKVAFAVGLLPPGYALLETTAISV